MTRKKALKATHKIWNKLADLEDKTGIVQDLDMKNKLGIKFLHSCPCCQYVFDLDDNINESMGFHDCMECPMISFWPHGCKGFEGDCADYTAYNGWDEGESGCARKIANAALELYNKEQYMDLSKQAADILKSMIVKEVEDHIDKYMVNYGSDMDNFEKGVRDQGEKLDKLILDVADKVRRECQLTGKIVEIGGYRESIENDLNNFTDVITKLKANIADRFSVQRGATEGLIGSIKTLNSDMADYEDQREDMDTLISNQAVAIAGLNVRVKKLEQDYLPFASIPAAPPNPTFKKGEIVMFRNGDKSTWHTRFFWKIDGDEYRSTSDVTWKQCRKLNATERGE